jgi:hypothetical protein
MQFFYNRRFPNIHINGIPKIAVKTEQANGDFIIRWGSGNEKLVMTHTLHVTENKVSYQVKDFFGSVIKREEFTPRPKSDSTPQRRIRDTTVIVTVTVREQ